MLSKLGIPGRRFAASCFGHAPTAFAMLVTLFTAASADARSHHRRDEEREQKAVEPAPPAGPLFFVISTARQHVSVYGSNGLYARAPVSTGRPDHPTPLGIFTIIGKERFHRSNIYSDAPMPFMQRITWSGVAMHEGVLPGYAASHGCIRMPHDFAKRMFGYTEGNERVIISRQDIIPLKFAHPNLPVPKFMAIPSASNIASGSDQILQNAISASQISTPPNVTEKVNVAVKEEKDDSGQKLLNPIEFAKAMKARAATRAAEAASALAPARGAVQSKVKEVRQAVIAVRKAQIALENAKDRAEAAARRFDKFPGGEDLTQTLALLAAKADTQAKVKDAEAALTAAKDAKAEKDQDEESAIKAYKDADNIRRAADDAVKSWKRRLAPLSVFISRKTRRLYIRQGFIKVFDVPVTIRDPEKPIGTHLFMAMPPDESAPGGMPALRWLVLTIPEKSAESPERRHRHHHHYEDEDGAPLATAPVSASEALDRIEVPAEVEGKISEMLWSGSSLIVSDSGISSETGDGTDFVILTR